MLFPKIIFLYLTTISEEWMVQHLHSLPQTADCVIQSLSSISSRELLFSQLSDKHSRSFGLLITDTTMTTAKEPIPFSLLPTIGFGTNHLFGIPYVFETLEALDADGISLVFCRFHQIPLTILETKHLQLKEWSPKDATDLKKLYDSFPASDHLPVIPDTLSEIQQYLLDYQKGAYEFFGYGLWAVIEKQTKHIIGQCGIEYKEREGVSRYELQYMITPSAQRNGFAFEICSEVLCYARDYLSIDTIHALIERNNTRSRFLIEKLGFQKIDCIMADTKQVLVYEKSLLTME